MKFLLLLSLFILFASLRQKNTAIPTKLTIIYNNDLALRPIATTKEDFWSNIKYLDTVEINSSRIGIFFVDRISQLKKVDYTFSVSAAIIFRNGKNVSDTVYTDNFFHNFLVRGVNYIDDSKEKELRKMFGGFFMFYYE